MKPKTYNYDGFVITVICLITLQPKHVFNAIAVFGCSSVYSMSPLT
ncbi:hypothetical protein [Candidatus Endolissoclinum faulkneri]|nr:hypothetical protein [Candidatus Endolissoclinum faulkneri]